MVFVDVHPDQVLDLGFNARKSVLATIELEAKVGLGQSVLLLEAEDLMLPIS